MTLGLFLSGSVKDVAALGLLARARPDLSDAPWTIVPDGAGWVITSEGLDEIPGLDLVEVPTAPGRVAPSLAEAVPPIPVPGEPPADDAIFVMPPEAATPLLERLLLLGRDDVQVQDLAGGVEPLFCIRVASPPLYTLMRARDQREERTTAYVSMGPGLWIEWCHTHPLAAIASRRLVDRMALVDGAGRWRFLPAWSGRSIYEALEPKLHAPRIDLTPAPQSSRFVIKLRLTPGPEHEPDLWLVDESAFFRLEHFLDEAKPEEIRPLTVARLEKGDRRPLYLIRERPQPGTSRTGTRISEVLGTSGFAKNVGTDNLYLPIGRRLLPNLQREALRQMLDLDNKALVIVDEDTDGTVVMDVADLDESALSSWVDYVATDRRLELDRLLERTVFQFPPMEVERPVLSVKAPPAVPPPQPDPRVIGSRPQKPVDRVDAPSKPVERDVLDDLAEIREQARELQTRVAAGGCDDSGVWRELARLHLKLGDVDEACACMEGALFYGAKPPALVAALVKARTDTPIELMDLAVREPLGPRDASLLAARLLEAVVAKQTLLDDLVQAVLQNLAEPGLPVSRRIAWVALFSWHKSVDDKLGLTRVKEAVLGTINDRGLSEIYDLPRFVRYALALEDDDLGTQTRRVRGEQLDAVERTYEQHFRDLPEFDAMANFVRVIFAVGNMRLGAAARARDLVGIVEHELPAHDAPNQVLYRLYLARMAFEGADGDDAAWRTEVEQILSGAERAGRRPASWLAKRSIWLGRPDDRPSPVMRQLVDRMLIGAESGAKPLGETITRLCRDRVYRLHDWERTAVIERLIRAALASGNDERVAEALDAAEAELDEITILGHQIRAVGACIRGAATLDEEQRVDSLVSRIVRVAGAKDVPWVRELLVAVKPCLMVLRRLGAKSVAERLLVSLEPVPTRTKLDASLLASALADGYLQLGELKKADELIERALALVFDPELDYVSRYESGALAIDVLRHWPTRARSEYFGRFFGALRHFKDLFTTSEHFRAHEILILERLVDAMADSETRQSDRVQAFLDLEEHAIRSRIIADWKEVCGR